MEKIIRLFPPTIKQQLERKLIANWHALLEIRLRIGKRIELNFIRQTEWIDELIFTENDRNYVLNQLSEHSLYRFETELREGFITIKGGHRVGLAGKVTALQHDVKGLQFITSFNIRIAQQMDGVAHSVIRHLYRYNQYLHTLIIGAPQSGKTTLLRDLCRLIGNGTSFVPAKKVAIIDERSEIAASKDGIPQFNVGYRTDVMDSCPKSVGMMMMIRSMSPDVIIVDEIGSKDDVRALLDVFHAGVTVICTVHGSSLAEVQKRLSIRQLFQDTIFKRYIVLSYDKTTGFTYDIFDEYKQCISSFEGAL